MRQFIVQFWLCIACLWTSAHAVDLDAVQVFERYRQATGGAAWDELGSIASNGQMAVGGLRGSLQVLEEPASGRSRTQYDLQVIAGAQGFDGAQSWAVDPSGEVRISDATEARQQAASQAWLVRRAYWFPQRQAADYGPVQVLQAEGRDYHVLQVRPLGGVPLTLWFDADTHLLWRSVMETGVATTTTTYSDWREVSAIRLPYASVQDSGDPRSQVQMQFEHIELRAATLAADFAPPKSETAARIDDPSGLSEIDFALHNNHIFVDARIDDQPVRMLVDTGGVNLLTPAAAARLGLSADGQIAGRGVGEQQVDVGFAKARRLQLGAAVLVAPTLYVLDLNILEQIEGEAFDGVIGYELFHHFGVQIDYAGKQLTLSEKALFQPPAGAMAIPFELAERIPIINAELDGLPLRLTVDTGSRANLSIHSPFARQHKLVEKYQALPESVTGWGVGGPATGRMARLGVLSIGDHTLRHLAADLHTGSSGAFADASTSANLGGGVLKRFTVAFDYAARLMYLLPNADFANDQANLEDRSGLWLRLDQGGALRVVAVADDSAAASAGLQVDQRILSINDIAVDQRHLAHWRALLSGPAGTRIKLQVEGERKVRVLRLADRLPQRSVVLK